MPVHVTGITDATSIGANNGAAYNGACVSLATGEVKCWGSNYEGVLGTTSIPTKTAADTGAALTPVTADGITNATQVAVGFSNACARLSDGGVKCWGRNTSKVLGDDSLPTGQSSYIPTPTTVIGLTGATSVSVGSGRACAMRAGGAVCWGGGSATPTAISGDPGFTQVSSTAGGCGIKAGVESCWGPNDMHQVGNKDIPTGSQVNPYRATTPVPVSGLPAKVASIGTSYYDSCAVLTTGAIWCWGYDLWGALGTGTNTQGNGTGTSPIGRLPQRVANI